MQNPSTTTVLKARPDMETEDVPSLSSPSRAPEAPKAKSPRKKAGVVFWLGLIVILAGGGLWLNQFVQRSLAFVETDDAYINGHIHQISARIAGSVTEVLVQANESVKAGQVLARIDPLALEISLQKAKAALAQAKASALQAQSALAQAQAQGAEAQAQVTSAEAKARQAGAQAEIARLNLERNQRLFQADGHGVVARQEVETTRSVAQATAAAQAGAQADLAAAKLRVQACAAAVEAAQAEISGVEAKITAQAADVRDAERELSYCAIMAPVDGRIGNKNIEVGNPVQTGQALFALVESNYWIIANFKETQIRKLHTGQPVEITVDAVEAHQFSGHLESLAPATGAQFALLPADNATGNFTKVVQRVPVKIVFDQETVRGFEDRLRPGLSAVVSVRIK